MLRLRRRPFLAIASIAIVGWSVDIAHDAELVSSNIMVSVQLGCYLGLIWTIFPTLVGDECFPYRYASAFVLTLGFLTVGAGWTEELSRQIMWLERNPGIRQHIERTTSIAWIISPFLLIVLHARQIGGMKSQFSVLVDDRTKELSNANHRLRQEIRERLLVLNERDLAKQDLQEALDTRTERTADPEHAIVRSERLMAMNQLSTGIAHELNNTLTPAVSYASLLLSKAELPDQQQNWLRQLSRSTLDAISIVRNLELFYRAETGEVFDLVLPSAVIDEAIESTELVCQDDSGTRRSPIQVTKSYESNQAVMGNHQQLVRVLADLLLNSAQAIGDGHGKITVSVTSGCGMVNIDVADTGRGMSPDEIKRCFDPFYSTTVNGTGLGLSVCHGIIQRHGGSFDISTNAHGTTMTIHLPIPTQERTQSHGDPDHASESLTNIRLLLVEDHASVRVSVADMLETMGAKVHAVASGPEALVCLKAMPFDIVFSDLGLPNMDGGELIERIRESHDVPIILMSGWPQHKIMERLAGKPKPNSVLSKPTAVQDIISTIQHWTGRKSDSPIQV